MVFNKVSLFVVICLIGLAQGSDDGCPGYEADSRCQIACRSPSRCYELEGSFVCCNQTGSHGNGYTNILDNQNYQKTDPGEYYDSILGRKDNDDHVDIVDAGLDVAEIIISIEILILFVAFVTCCSYCWSFCSPYHRWRHANSTNVTVVQPAGVGGGNVQNNFCVSVPTQPVTPQPCAMTSMQQAPPPYNPGYGQQFGGVGQI